MDAVVGKLLHGANVVATALYRLSRGKIGGTAKGTQVMLITVPGRKTGIPHTNPVSYFEHDGGYLVSGSSGGAKRAPQWIRNLATAGSAHVEIGAREFDVDARVLAGAERDQVWNDVVLAHAPFFARYETKSGRTIPVARLSPRSCSGRSGAAATLEEENDRHRSDPQECGLERCDEQRYVRDETQPRDRHNAGDDTEPAEPPRQPSGAQRECADGDDDDPEGDLPLAMPVVHRLPVPMIFGQIRLRDARPGSPHHPVDHLPVSHPLPTMSRRAVRQQRLQQRPMLHRLDRVAQASRRSTALQAHHSRDTP